MWFQVWHEELGELSEHPKAWKLYIDGIFLSKAYTTSVSVTISEVLYVMTVKGVARFKQKLTCGLKNYIRNLVNFHAHSWKSVNLDFDWIHFFQSRKIFRWKSTEALCLMTLNGDAKFGEKLTLGSKNEMKNLVSFNASSGTSGNLHFDLLLLPIAQKVSA